ncbi:MAG: hypothetical protein RLY34_200 [Actinomycetota bacterium]
MLKSDNLRYVDVDPGQEFNAFAELVPVWAGWLATYVVDSNGRHVDENGSSANLGDSGDLSLLMSLREKADVIVTTGATARAENYRPSRFAPITVITKKPESLAELPLFVNPGTFTNQVFEPTQEALFSELTSYLNEQGYSRFLFEGGPSLLHSLSTQTGPISVILNIANVENQGSVDPKQLLLVLSPALKGATLLDDAVIGSNRVTRWSVTA